MLPVDDLDLIEALWGEALLGGPDAARSAAEGDLVAEAFFRRDGRTFHFNPNQHPRDAYGKFAQALGGLAPGDRAQTPGGVTVTRTRSGYHVRGARARSLDLRSSHTDPREAAAAALTIDQTPREATRIAGRRHKQGAALNRRQAAALKRGAPVVTGAGEYGRIVGVERAPRARDDRAVVELDPRDPTRSSKPHTQRVSLDALSAAVPLEPDPEGSHEAPREESPAQIDREVRAGLGHAARHVAMGGAGDALHFIEDFGHRVEGMDRATRERLVRSEAEARQRRSAFGAETARVQRELAAIERQLRRVGIVPEPGLPPARLRDGVQIAGPVRRLASPGRPPR
jgi:hypothetical protein